MEKVYNGIDNCCGCALCEDVCPKNAITMFQEDGFYYPTIDKNLCVDCGLCAKKCPVHNINVDSKPQWGNRCTMCLACYHACPYHAIEYGKRTRNKGQYSI